jgi:hypothetical protein
MIEGGLCEIGFESMMADDDFVKGSPAVATGPDVIDQIALLTRPGRAISP